VAVHGCQLLVCNLLPDFDTIDSSLHYCFNACSFIFNSVVAGCIGIQEGSHIHKSELIQTLLGSSPNFLAKLNACSSMYGVFEAFLPPLSCENLIVR